MIGGQMTGANDCRGDSEFYLRASAEASGQAKTGDTAPRGRG